MFFFLFRCRIHRKPIRYFSRIPILFLNVAQYQIWLNIKFLAFLKSFGRRNLQTSFLESMNGLAFLSSKAKMCTCAQITYYFVIHTHSKLMYVDSRMALKLIIFRDLCCHFSLGNFVLWQKSVSF